MQGEDFTSVCDGPHFGGVHGGHQPLKVHFPFPFRTILIRAFFTGNLMKYLRLRFGKPLLFSFFFSFFFSLFLSLLA